MRCKKSRQAKTTDVVNVHLGLTAELCKVRFPRIPYLRENPSFLREALCGIEKRVQLMVVTTHLLQLKPGASQSRVHSDWKYSTLVIGKQSIRGLVIDPRFKNGCFRNCQVSASKPARSLCLVLHVTTELRAKYHSAATASSSSAG